MMKMEIFLSSEMVQAFLSLIEKENGHGENLVRKEKIQVKIPKDFVIKRRCLKKMEANKSNDYLLWIGHNTYLLHIENTYILFDPWFEKRAGFFGLFGPKRFLDAAIKISDLPKIDLILISHSHLEHFSEILEDGTKIKGILK